LSLPGIRNLYWSIHCSQEELSTPCSANRDTNLHFVELKGILFIVIPYRGKI
jgi:hypothetical protein